MCDFANYAKLVRKDNARRPYSGEDLGVEEYQSQKWNKNREDQTSPIRVESREGMSSSVSSSSENYSNYYMNSGNI